jgi:glycosyltransferase involved in cell wall biosynthesis
VNSSLAERKRLAFVTCGPLSGINDRLLPLLLAAFPELEPDPIDIPTLARADRRLLLVNLLHVLREHGPRPFLDRRRLWGAFFRTAHMFEWVRQTMRERCVGRDYAFTFQTQSIFDASVDGVPHFLYTDHTELANAYYPDHRPEEAPAERWLRREREIYRRAEIVFTMSGHVTRSLEEHYGMDSDHVLCVYAGANVEATESEGLHDYTGERVLFVGRDWERKGGPDLLAAFELVRQRHPGASLVVAGSSPAVTSAGVEVLGEVALDAVGRLFDEATVFCMPTLIEPFGLVFVEALAHRVPVVATAVGAVPDVVQEGETGCLVEPHDVEALAATIGSLLDDPERCRRFGELGSGRMRERYTWPHVVEAIAGAIRERLAPAESASAP